MNKKTSVGGMVIVLIAAAIGGVFGKELVRALMGTGTPGAPTQQNLRDVLLQASNKTNESLPTMVDRDTRLDSTTVGPRNSWIYLYTLVTMSSRDVARQELQQAMGEQIRNGVCTTKEMRVFIDRGVTMIYRYRGSDGAVIGDIVVEPSECKR